MKEQSVFQQLSRPVYPTVYFKLLRGAMEPNVFPT